MKMGLQTLRLLGAGLRERLPCDGTPAEIQVLLLRLALNSLEQLHYGHVIAASAASDWPCH
jgi:hypothetical protein